MILALLKKFHVVTLLLAVLSLLLFVIITKDVISADSITTVDQWVYAQTTHIHNSALTHTLLFITNLFAPINIFLLAIGLLLLFAVRRRWEHMYILIFSLLGGVIIEQLLKLIIHRERPVPLLLIENGYSFPSGHATISTIFLMLLIYAYKDQFKKAWKRNLFIILSVGTFIIVAISRVYLGVHWVSDVLAGICLGVFWLTLFISSARALNHFHKRKLRRELV